MVDEAVVRKTLDANEHMREMLFPFGFLFTRDTQEVSRQGFPFYDMWRVTQLPGYSLLTHPQQTVYLHETDDSSLFLIGHAYNPFSMVHDEAEILATLYERLIEGEAEYAKGLNELTGIFTTGYIHGKILKIFGDATGMQTVYYGLHEGEPYLSSHAALIGTLCELEQSDYVRRLVAYRFYPLLGKSLPGDISPYDGFRRLIPNHSLTYRGEAFTTARFWPPEKIVETTSDEQSHEVAQEAAEILQNSMELIAQKWDQPAISLTGGVDSQTTLAAATDHFDEYRYFSYTSSPEEAVDTDAAQRICSALGLEHELFEVPVEEIQDRADFENISSIIEYSYGNIGAMKSHEVAKRIVLRESDINVEIKSWVSEVGRAYYHKRFAKRRFQPEPTSRTLTSLYKVFIHDRDLVRETDRIFRDYQERYHSRGGEPQIAWWDQVFWEYRVSAWNGSVTTGEHRVSFEIDIPYNNRILLATLLKAPLSTRITDSVQRDIRTILNRDINRTGITVKNLRHTTTRAWLERLYLYFNTLGHRRPPSQQPDN